MNHDAERAAMIYQAVSDLGVPYYWGGNEPEDGGLDCSGAVLRWMRAGGIVIKDTTAGLLFAQLPKTEDPKPGDMVFYGKRDQPATHVVMVLGVDPAGSISIVGANGGGRKSNNESRDEYIKRMASKKARVRIALTHRYREDVLGFRTPPFDTERTAQ